MVEQFLRVADDLGWDVGDQIAKLEEFAEHFGVSGRLEEFLERRGIAGSARRDLKRVRDTLLDFVEVLGNRGAMNHFLQRELRLAAEAAARARAEAAAQEAVREAGAGATQAVRGTGFLGWLRRRTRIGA
ncbi:hypothetical protein [Arhodomonas sp. AD133]|uniref:hypothetical protein n=1 Tax=Arhodomonas sp. AD133 TaxID=3415009 RepID=UPI003EB9FF2C